MPVRFGYEPPLGLRVHRSYGYEKRCAYVFASASRSLHFGYAFFCAFALRFRFGYAAALCVANRHVGCRDHLQHVLCVFRVAGRGGGFGGWLCSRGVPAGRGLRSVGTTSHIRGGVRHV